MYQEFNSITKPANLAGWGRILRSNNFRKGLKRQQVPIPYWHPTSQVLQLIPNNVLSLGNKNILQCPKCR